MKDEVEWVQEHLLGKDGEPPKPKTESFTARPPPRFYVFERCHRCKQRPYRCHCHRAMRWMTVDDVTNPTVESVLYTIHWLAAAAVTVYAVCRKAQCQ